MKNRITAVISIVAVAAFLLTGCGGSNAEGSTESNGEKPGEENLGSFEASVVDGKIDMPTFGISVTIPQAWLDTGEEIKAVGFVSDFFAYANIYIVDPNNPNNYSSELVQIMAQREPVNVEKIADEEGCSKDVITIIGDNKTLYYYALDLDRMNKETPELIERAFAESDISDEQLDRIKSLWPAEKELFSSVEIRDLTLPPIPKVDDLNNNTMELSTKDLDGNDVKLGDIVKGNKVTLVNVWGTFCAPCVREMPDLTAFYEKYKDQGFGVVGLTVDALDDSDQPIEEAIEDGKDIVSTIGITYPVLRETNEMKNVFVTSSYPTSYFVDQNGKQIGETIVGARTGDVWEKTIQDMLSEVQ